MTYYAGAWEYGGGNGMQVAMDVTWSAVSHGSTSVTATVLFYTDNQYSYSDNQTLNISSNLGSDYSFNNNDGTSEVYRTTRTYTYTYPSGSYGSSPGNVTFSATISGAYNGVTPTVSATLAIPARPIAVPTMGTTTLTTNVNSFYIDWTVSNTGGDTIDYYHLYKNGAYLLQTTAGAYTDNVGPGVTASYKVYAHNSAGWSAASNTVSGTTPALPTYPGPLVADASTFGTIGLSWTASDGDGFSVVYDVRRNGTLIAGNTPNTSFDDTTVSPSTEYVYTVVAKTSVGSSGSPSVTVTSLGGIAGIWNGTTYVTALPQIWNGTAWVNGQARVWNGTEWKYGS